MLLGKLLLFLPSNKSFLKSDTEKQWKGKITPKKNEKLFFMNFFVKTIENDKVIYF